MAQEKLTYQIVASGVDEQAGRVFRAQLGTEPFHIGSGDQADMKLEGEQIQPVHARVLATTTGQVILINLGAPGTLLINGGGMDTYKPAYWKPGVPSSIDHYELQLELLEPQINGDKPGPIRQVLVTQPSEVVQPSGGAPKFVIDWGSSHAGDAEKPDDAPPPIPVGKGTVQYSEEEILGSARADKPVISLNRPDAPSEPPSYAALRPKLSGEVESPVNKTGTRFVDIEGDAAFGDDTHRHILEPDLGAAASGTNEDDSEELARTPDMPFAFHIRDAQAASPGVPKVPMMSGTLPKDWQQMGYLSAQATINPVNLVAGERVRVPISVRNSFEHVVNLRVHVAGLPSDQVTAPEKPLQLLPGEVGAFDLILHTRPPVDNPRQEIMIRLRDSSLPEAAITLPLSLNFKNAPDITGRLDPATVWDKSPTYLHLQNHTKAAANVFVTGHSDIRGLYVIPTQTQVSVFPGQAVKIPVRIDVPEKRLLRSSRYSFSVSAQEGSRAPLDFPGTVRVRARVPVALLALLMGILLIVAAGVVLLSRRETAPANQTTIVPETPVQSQVEITEKPSSLPAAPGESTEEIQDSPTPRPSATATTTRTASPTATAPANVFEDPRAPDCAVPIPEGWSPYVVKAGDRVYRLAVDRGTTVDEVARVNCLANPRIVYVGNVLLLPTQ